MVGVRSTLITCTESQIFLQLQMECLYIMLTFHKTLALNGERD